MIVCLFVCLFVNFVLIEMLKHLKIIFKVMNISLLSRGILICLNLLCHGSAKLWLIKTNDGNNDNNGDDRDVDRAGSGVEYGLDYKEYKDYEIYEDYMDYMDYMEGQSQSDSRISIITKMNDRCLKTGSCALSPKPPECGNKQVWNQDRIRCVSPHGAPQYDPSFPIKTFCQFVKKAWSAPSPKPSRYYWANYRGVCLKKTNGK